MQKGKSSLAQLLILLSSMSFSFFLHCTYGFSHHDQNHREHKRPLSSLSLNTGNRKVCSLPKHIICCVSTFNLYRMSIYYLHTDTLSFLVVHIQTEVKLLSCITMGFYCKYMIKKKKKEGNYFLLFNNRTQFICFFMTQLCQIIFLHLCKA